MNVIKYPFNGLYTGTMKYPYFIGKVIHVMNHDLETMRIAFSFPLHEIRHIKMICYHLDLPWLNFGRYLETFESKV
jgi:hypothetical protein